MFLNCKTYFSFRYGTYSTEELVNHAAAIGLKSLALTNINSTCDLWDFVDFCRKKGIKPVAGAEIRNGDTFLYLVLVQNDAGLLWLHHFISQHLENELAFPERTENTDGVYVIYPLGRFPAELLGDNELIGVKPEEATKLYSHNAWLYPEKFVVRHPVTFQQPADYNLHKLLRCIDKNTLLSKLLPEEHGQKHEHFVPVKRIEKAFELYPFVTSNTYRVMSNCRIGIELETDKNKQTFGGNKADDRELLQKLAYEGMLYRYGRNNREAIKRVNKELKIINDLGFNAYFLITWDITRYAESRKFYYVGRGSGANSIVAYCLKITDVDPIDLDLYFERFLNPHRTSPPDFDMDFSWKDRDEIIDYVFKRYGREHVALLGMYATFQKNAAVRELGKVVGLPKAEIDTLLGSRDATFREDSNQRLILNYGTRMLNFPNHQSIHPGGMLISEKPIRQYAAIDMPPKGFATAQLDMFVAEKVGLFKLDILSQRGLGHIKDAITLIRQNRQIDIDIHRVKDFMVDPKVADQIRRADTIGCFYIESPAMRQLLKKLRCDNYITLVAASSIIRPGVSQSGMMKQYIQRFHKPDSFDYLHPVMKEHLQETYGVMVYQEDVIKIAHYYAGLDMGEADILRRAMSGKYRSRAEFDRIRDKFFEGAKALGRPQETSREVWRQIQSFGGYSFSKAHSASFAVESYQSLYLKTYYPLEFMVAVINNFGGFYSRELYFHELKKAGAIVHPPCINNSDELTNIYGCEVYMGFIHVQGLESKVTHIILNERTENGAYQSLDEFMDRTGIGKEQVNILIQIGAFRFTGISKKALLWKPNFLKSSVPSAHPKSLLFQTAAVEFALPELTTYDLDDAMDEIELLGFPLCNPFLLVEDENNYITAKQLPDLLGSFVMSLCYLITYKPVYTVKKENMFFGTFIDGDGDWIDTVHFPDSAKQYPLQGRGFYRIFGKVVEEFGVYAIETHKMEKIGIKGRAEKANQFWKKDKSHEQLLVRKSNEVDPCVLI